MDKTIGWITIIILVILAIMVALAAVIVSFYHVTTSLDTSNVASKQGGNVRDRRIGGGHPQRDPKRLPRFNDDSTPGASNGDYHYTGNARSIRRCGAEGSNSVQVNGRCQCLSGYWGLHCELQSYSHDFVAIGNIDGGDYDHTNYDVQTVANLRECEHACDGDCQGFYYENDSCVLLSETPSFELENMPTFEPMQQSNLYLKRGTHPIISDRVFLYENTLPLRYWLGTRDDVIAMEPGRLYQLPFLPEGWVNDGRYRLAYSDQPFEKPSQAKFIQYGNIDFVPQLYQWAMVVSHTAKC